MFFQDVKTNAAKPVDIGMINICEKAYLGWDHRIFLWEEEFQMEFSPRVARIWWSINGYPKMSRVIAHGHSYDPWDRVFLKSLCLADDPLGKSHCFDHSNRKRILLEF